MLWQCNLAGTEAITALESKLQMQLLILAFWVAVGRIMYPQNVHIQFPATSEPGNCQLKFVMLHGKGEVILLIS